MSAPNRAAGPVLTVIAGPTASGKSGLAVQVARALGAELVSADSQQVYRHFDVGTAKPSRAELDAVPHHLISCVDPGEDFSAARYLALADEAIAQVASRGRRVVVVGGTGLYLRCLLHGVVEAPPRDEGYRAELEALADREGNQVLHAALEQVDPASAARLPVGDRVRQIRALEIHHLTGQAASARREAHGFKAERYRAVWWVLDPPREGLYRAIEARAQGMFDAGLVEETRALVEGYRDCAPMRSVGYAQALDCLEGRLKPAEAVALVAKETRHYAKRQWTWFRKEAPGRLVAPPWSVEAIAQAHRDAEG